ncbi:MAG: hypothetical protein JJ979_02830 [Roseibium sp.]|nr:hypothetical protein [Roseibium sp.]
MSEDLKWIVGIILGVVTLIGGYITRDRQIQKQMRDGDDKLHERVNKVREDFVRREDLDGHIHRLDSNVQTMRDEMREHRRETTQRLDTLISLQSKKSD